VLDIQHLPTPALVVGVRTPQVFGLPAPAIGVFLILWSSRSLQAPKSSPKISFPNNSGWIWINLFTVSRRLPYRKDHRRVASSSRLGSSRLWNKDAIDTNGSNFVVFLRVQEPTNRMGIFLHFNCKEADFGTIFKIQGLQ
jgi:hypothetical protein